MMMRMTKAAIARGLTRFSGEVAVSVTASVAAAAVLAFLQLQPGMARRAVPLPETPSEVMAERADATPSAPKYAERYQLAYDSADTDPAGSRRNLLLPASLLMPMAVTWAAPADSAPTTVPRAEPHRSVTNLVAGPAVARERSKVAALAQPLPISPPPQRAAASTEASTEPATAQGATVLALPEGLARAGQMLGGLADRVGAAGTWTVSTASQLLPSW